MKLKFKIVILTIFLIITYIIVNSIIGKDKFNNIKNFLNQNQKQILKKYIFPYKYISEQKLIILRQKGIISDTNINNLKLELKYKENLYDLSVSKKPKKIKLKNNLILTKYKVNGLYYGIWNNYPGSGYLNFHNNNLVLISARGILSYQEESNNNKNFKQIKNNISNFINNDQYDKFRWFSVKGLHINNDKIYISYTEEIKKNCWNTSVIFSYMNYEEIIFEKLFSSNKCIAENNIDNEFNAWQSGGKIVSLNNNQIILSIGDYRLRAHAQDKNSINGKLIKINVNNFDYKIISMGHRNPQGLYVNKENNFILATEHGPQGGDEINLIKLNQNEIPNYGWPIASDGEHYGGRIEQNKLKYKKYPLLKSHSENGFIEPLKSFIPSIGISSITKISDKSYVASSTRDKSIYFLDLDDKNKIVNFNRIEVFERVRDMIYKNQKLYLFLEDTASIGIIEII